MTTFIELQRAQKQHDQTYHADIFYLAYPDRMRHFVFHFAKYVGRLVEAQQGGGDLPEALRKTVADTFIIVLAASDVLNLDLDAKMAERHGEKQGDMRAWARRIRVEGRPMSPAQLTEWWLLSMAVSTGRMAKALESLDHMEPLNARQWLTDGALEILDGVLVAADQLNLDLAGLTAERWREVEKRRVL